ncbi:hypothetical protein ACFO3O_13810 [Dokdonia ponticola]|uniref:Uncharacterized protein n=1 Tax=Dokdonia ponticola TaxID=2041041 RepID=A0ABV9HYS9_9FLAO
MKTISKKNTLSLEKFQIAKLNNLRSIKGGIANNNEEETQEEDTTTIWTTTMTKIDPSISG